MSLQAYVSSSSAGFSPEVQTVLNEWYREFSIDYAWQLIQKNIDSECLRQDIHHGTFQEYLRDLAANYLLGRGRAHPDPITIMDDVFNARRCHFLLPGQLLPRRGMNLSRVMRLDHLLKYQLYPAGIAILKNVTELATDIEARKFSGQDLIGSHIGRAEYPVWICKTEDLAVCSADTRRNRLGLKHIDHGHLVEIIYPDNILSTDHLSVRAPTILDAAAGGAENWVFVKRRSPGGPEWGHTVNLASMQIGVAEAVHRDFCVDLTKGLQIQLRYCGQIENSAPQVNFLTLLTSI